jgi:hypothetical protein
MRVAGSRGRFLVWWFLGLVVFFFWASNLKAQSIHIIGKSVFELRTESPEVPTIHSELTPISYVLPTEGQNLPDLRAFIVKSPEFQVPGVYRYQDLAFFCRLEVKLEQASKIPVRFRLGTVDYVDYLEGKIDRY